jgi:hypothetical protein
MQFHQFVNVEKFSSKLLLCKMKLIDSSVSVTQFQREVHSFIECNMNKFFGLGDDGDDAILQYPWGIKSRLKNSANLKQVGDDL